MSCHKGDTVAKWSECWPGRQDFCVLILAPLQATPSVTPGGNVVSVPPVCAVAPHLRCGCGCTWVFRVAEGVCPRIKTVCSSEPTLLEFTSVKLRGRHSLAVVSVRMFCAIVWSLPRRGIL